MEFYKGQRVELTDEAVEMFSSKRFKPPYSGTIMSKSTGRGSISNGLFIKVQLDGRKGVESWHRKFWKTLN